MRPDGFGQTLPLHGAPTTVARADAEATTVEAGPETATGATAIGARYRLGGELARGGLAMIREAHDTELGRRVAVKQPLVRDPVSDARFVHEARVTARLAHPSIVPIYDVGADDRGAPFYVMKWVDGRPLHQLIALRPELDERLALIPNLIAVAEAVAYAHSQDVIHRDLKPANIIVGAFGETVVIDWGLALEAGAPSAAPDSVPAGPEDAVTRPRSAVVPRGPTSTDARLTSQGSVIGTPAYMPPEQGRGEDVDRRADVYALGASLYHLIAGEAPYTIASSLASATDPVWVQVLAGPPEPLATLEPAAPPELVAIVETAMAREPGDRHGDASALAAALTGFLRHHASHQLASAASERLRELSGRLGEVRTDDPAAQAAVARDADVVRFGFDQALQAWPENPAARAGLRRFQEQLFGFEVDAGNLAAATALTAELPADQARAARLAALAAALERKDSSAAAFVRARDRTVGRRERIALLAVCGLMLAGFFVESLLAGFTPLQPGASRRLHTNAAMLASIATALMFVTRRKLFANEFSRRGGRLVLALLVVTVTHRGIGLVVNEPATHMFVLDLLVVSVAMLVFGDVAMILGLVALIGAWVCALLPEISRIIYNAIVMGIVGVLAWSWSRAGRGRTGPDAGS